MSHVDAVRRFNRFYTRRIGVLQPSYLGQPFPLPQARVLYELGHRGECTASELGAELDLDLRLSQPAAAGPEAPADWCRENAPSDDARQARA